MPSTPPLKMWALSSVGGAVPPGAASELGQVCAATFNSALDLDSFLLKPMQRVTKMPLLVRGILKSTPSGTPLREAPEPATTG